MNTPDFLIIGGGSAGVEFPEPAWKTFPEFAPVVRPRQKTFTGDPPKC